MRTRYGRWDARRAAPRLSLDALCNEVHDGKSRLGFAIELSPEGVRLERPFRPGPRPTELELEFSLPGEDDVVVAEAHVRFDEVRRATPGSALAAAHGLVRVTGLQLGRLAAHDRRLIREFVMDRWSMRPFADPGLLDAACYARG